MSWPTEFDSIEKWTGDGWTSVQVREALLNDREEKRLKGPDLTTVRRFFERPHAQAEPVRDKGSHTNLQRQEIGTRGQGS